MSSSLVRLRRQKFNQFVNQMPNKASKSNITKLEAEVLINRINSASSSVFKNVVLLIVNKGHLALGFTKPQDCLRKRVPDISNSYICRLLRATDTYLLLDNRLQYLHKVTEATFRPLQDVTQEDAQSVWNAVINQCKTTKRITSKDIRHAMKDLGIESKSTKMEPGTKTIEMDAELQETVDRYVSKIGNVIRLSHVSTKEEWRQLSKLIYQQLLATCPILDSLSDKVAA